VGRSGVLGVGPLGVGAAPAQVVEADEQKPVRHLFEMDRTVFDESINGAHAQAYERRGLLGCEHRCLRLALFTQDACAMRLCARVETHAQRFVRLGDNQRRLFGLHVGEPG
jgi:hypothetical protein